MAKIYASTSSVINCVYTLSIARDSNNNSNIVITASGTIYGNGSSENDSSDLYVHLCYNVSPANTTGTGAPTNRGTRFGDGQKIVTRPLNKNSIPKSGLTFNNSWTITDNAAKTFSNCALFLSGSATDQGLAGGVKSYMFTGEKLSSKISNQIRYYTQTLSVAAGYTNVSNPAASSIKFNSSSTTPLVVTPNANITVSWAAGTAGTNNAIKQYEVTLNGTTKTTANTYCDFSNLNLGRGTSYSAIVKAIPTISGYGPSSGETSTNKVKGNTLPTAPTITLSGTTILNNVNYIKSNGTATFSLSSSDADGHAITYYQNTTNSISGATAIGSSWSTNTEGTYYFWAKDSLGEPSSVSSKSFTKNVKPSANGTNLTLARTSQYTSNQITNWLKDYYYTAGKATITGVTSTCGVASYTWNIRTYNYDGGSDTPTFDTVVKDYTSATTTTNSCNYSYPTNGDWGKAYKIRCIITDKLGEQSDEIISEGYCVIPPAPSLDNDIWNTLNLSNVNGSLHKSFYQYMSTKVNYIDSSVTVEPTISGNAQVRLNDTTSFSSSGKIPLVISNTAEWTTYTLTLSLKSAWGGTSAFNSKTYNITRTGGPKVSEGSTNRVFSINDITFDGSTKINPFTDDTNFNIIFKNYISGNNFSGTGKEAKAYLSANGKMVAIVEAENRKSSEGVTIIKTKRGGPYATSGLYNWSTNELGLYLNSGNESVGFCIEFTDVFGISYYYTKWGLTFSFSETPTVTLTIGSSAGSTQGTIVKEGNTITYTPNITFYNTDKAVTIRTYIYRSTSTSSQTGGSWKLYNGTNPNNGITYTPSRGTSTDSAIVYNTPITYTVGEITESKYLYFKISITYGSNTINSNIPGTYYISQRHKKVDDLSVDVSYENDLFSYTTLLTDRGGGQITTSADDTATGLTEVNYGLQFSQTNDFSIIKTKDTRPIQNKKYYYINNDVYVEFEGENFVQGVEYYETTYQWLDPSGSLVTSINPTWREESSSGGAASYFGSNIDLGSGWSFYNIRPVYYTKIGNVEKTTYGLISTIYGISPTISYRKNQIGVNISNIENRYPEAIIAVGGATDKKYIEFHTVTANASIDLTTGALDGFIFDGGTWDQS